MEKIKLFFTALMVLVASNVAFAQRGEVTGVVKDAGTGETIPFASVRVKGTMTGAAADANGVYSIRVTDRATAVLVFSSVNYRDLEVQVSGRNLIDVELAVDATALEDVIVVAYGTQRKEAVTGSVSSLKGDGLIEAPVTSVDKMLAGKLAGVSISSSSGQPGAMSQIRIRGNGSVNASNAPLWVVDGIPVISGDISLNTNQSSALTNINPNDIESITVLKDAAAAAAYGSRAANGVILVTTKRGKEGQSVFTASVKYGLNWLQSDSGFRMMNAHELLTYQRDAILNAGMDPDDPTGAYYRPLSLLNGPLYNVVNEFSRLGNLQEYEISAIGGNSRSSYYSSFSYHKNEGVFHGVNYEKIQGRINASYKLLNNLETGVNINLAYINQTDVPMQSLYSANPIFAGMTLMPWEDIKPDGKWVAKRTVNSGEHPIASGLYDDKWDKTYRFNGTFYLKWTPVRHLDIETRNSAETLFQTSRMYYSPLAHDNSYAHQLETLNRDVVQLTTSNTVNYSNIFGGYHSVHALVGHEAMTYDSHRTNGYAPKVDANMPYLNKADQSTTEIGYTESAESMLSFFGIADYSYDNRYFAQATIRTDGSSLFGEANKWGLFWSVSGSWNISKEKFMSGVKPVSLLKLRVSYGVNGNNGIDPYQAYGLYGTRVYNGITTYVPSQLENRVLSWEKNKTLNVGLDFGFFENRLTGSIDLYNRKTVDLLLTKQLPETTGFSSIFSNVGAMSNSGIELLANYDIISNGDWLWSVGGNIAFNRTEILDLGGDTFINRLKSGDELQTVVGKSLYTYYLKDYYGVNPANGEALWVTEDGSLSNDYNKARKYYAGSPEPKYVGGFNTAVSWKGLSLSAFCEFKGGHKILMWNENHYLNSDGNQMSNNQFASATNYWKKPGDTGVNPKPVAGNTSNSNDWGIDRWMEDASYLRIKDVTLSYVLPKSVTRKMRLGNVKFYLSGLNLYCFNDVDFWDPEQGISGITAGAYPMTKAVVGGIELTF